jgi:hypothetical protein
LNAVCGNSQIWKIKQANAYCRNFAKLKYLISLL